ncbi:MAG: hypothetical protein ACRDRG_13525 [Pseudonocardiaceae bacterium]
MATKRIKHLSQFERRLNGFLWTVFTIALVYAFVQHVLLAHTAERFSSGAELGDLFYDLAIAYIGAFVFYLLVVALPLRRDRHKVYQYLAYRFGRVVGEACGLMNSLNEAAGVDANRKNSWPNVENTCTLIGPRSPANFGLLTPTGTVQGTVLDVIHYHMTRAHDVNREILSFATFLDSEALNLVAEIEDHLTSIDRMVGLLQQRSSTDMSVLARDIFDYLQLADHLDDYRHEFLPTTFSRRPELIAGSVRGSDASPLLRNMNS